MKHDAEKLNGFRVLSADEIELVCGGNCTTDNDDEECEENNDEISGVEVDDDGQEIEDTEDYIEDYLEDNYDGQTWDVEYDQDNDVYVAEAEDGTEAEIEWDDENSVPV